MGHDCWKDTPLCGLLRFIADNARDRCGSRGPSQANKTPVTPQQLEAYNEVFMDEVRKGDLLFHGDDATQKQMGVKLTSSAMACAMCHPFASDTHPQAFPKFQVSMNKFATLRDMMGSSDRKLRAKRSILISMR